jgi:hypothetical protein
MVQEQDIIFHDQEWPAVVQCACGVRFSFNGTLVEAWASMKSFRPKSQPDRPEGDDGRRNLPVNFRTENGPTLPTPAPPIPTPCSTARAPDGSQALLHRLRVMENRSSLLIDAPPRPATRPSLEAFCHFACESSACPQRTLDAFEGLVAPSSR